MIFLSFLFLLPDCAKSAHFNQSFDDLRNLSGRTLPDQSVLFGNAAVVNGTVQLTGSSNQKGEYIVPTLNGSSLGWRLNFTAFLRGPPTGVAGEGFGLVWGNASLFAENRNLLQRQNTTGQRTSRFAAWTVDTHNNPADPSSLAKSGFYIFNSSGIREDVNRNGSNMIALSKETLLNVSCFIAWNPVRGATFTTKSSPTQTAFANIVDHPIWFDGNDSYGWWFVAETTGVSQTVMIDDIVLETPCEDCMEMNGTCNWLRSSQLECILPSTEETTTTTEMPTFPTSTVATTTNLELTIVTEGSIATSSSDVVLQTIDSNTIMFSTTEFGAIVGAVVGVIVLLVVLLVAMVAWRRCGDGSESSIATTELKPTPTNVYGSLASVQQSTTAMAKENENQGASGGVYSNASVLGDRATVVESVYEPVTSPL